MAGLEVDVDEGDLAAFRRLALNELDGRLDRERRIADAAGAGQERDDEGLIRRARSRGADASDDGENFLGRRAVGDPVRVAGLDQLLVAPGGDVAADDNEEQVVGSFADDVDQFGEVLICRRRKQDGDRTPRPSERGPAELLHARRPLDIRDRGLEPALDLDERALVFCGLQEIDCHACSHFCRRA